MEHIIIDYAYDGFLYAPLFLAKDLGFFPANCELNFAKGDSEAIQALCDDYGPGAKHWFAICDPLSERAAIAIPRGDQRERLCLVASLIHAAPVWLYNTDPTIERLDSEADLQQHASKIKRIVTYPERTTGYLFGERIRRHFLQHISAVTPKAFGREFEDIDDETLVVTSDVLRVAKEDRNDRDLDLEKRKHAIIFRYPERGPDFAKNFLFTGILTLRDTVLKQNVDVLLAVLGAMRKGIHCVTAENVQEEHVQWLVQRFESQLSLLGLTTPHDREVHVRDALRHLRHLNLYHEALVPEKSAFTNADAQWIQLRNGHARDDKTFIHRIPALFLSETRFQNPELMTAVLDRVDKKFISENAVVQEIFKESPTSSPFKKLVPLFALGVTAAPFVTLFCVLGLVDGMRKIGKSFSDAWFRYSLITIVTSLLVILTFLLFSALFRQKYKFLRTLLVSYYVVAFLGGVYSASQLSPMDKSASPRKDVPKGIPE